MTTSPAPVTVTTFDNMQGGKTTQWEQGHYATELLAYLDANADGTFSVACYDPHTGKRKHYEYKTKRRANIRVAHHVAQYKGE